MIPVFIGYDTRETIAWHVLAHSILSRSSEPVSITPIGNTTLPRSLWWREKGPHDSTEFSNARFMVPALMDYQGWAIFMDCDMVCLADIAGLWAQRQSKYAVMVVKHEHVPRETSKFLGAEQARYRRKNWSSLMLLNCGHPMVRGLTPAYVNIAGGLMLHDFAWALDSDIGEIRGLWNVLAAPELQHPEEIDRYQVKLLHYTLGGPWHGYEPEGSHFWLGELSRMVAGENPCASSTVFPDGPGVIRQIVQFKERFEHEKAQHRS